MSCAAVANSSLICYAYNMSGDKDRNKNTNTNTNNNTNYDWPISHFLGLFANSSCEVKRGI